MLYASNGSARVLGVAAAQIIGTRGLDKVDAEDRDRVNSTMDFARGAPGQPFQFEARVRHGETRRWIESTVTDLSRDPAVGGLVWNCRDITERKKAEEALRESERRLATRERYLQTLLDSLPECVKVLGRDGEVLEMNAAGLRMIQADSAAQVLGNCVYPLIHPADRDAFRALTEGVCNGGECGSLEFSVQGLKGGQLRLETNVVPLRGESESIIGALSATRDVTERNLAITALRRANESLEQFAYAAAHDLQEPIRNLTLYTQLLAQDYSERLDDRAREFIGITVEGARRLQTLIEDLLAYTRSADAADATAANTDANAVVSEVLENLRTAVTAAGAVVVCGDLPTLPMCHAHVVQLFQNLIGNALKYRRDAPLRVEISCDTSPDEYVITVRDNGIGIPPDHRERIFGVFKRLHGRDVPGNGIGLAVCYRIVCRYGGRIWVEGNEDQGSMFRFAVPRRNTSESA